MFDTFATLSDEEGLAAEAAIAKPASLAKAQQDFEDAQTKLVEAEQKLKDEEAKKPIK